MKRDIQGTRCLTLLHEHCSSHRNLFVNAIPIILFLVSGQTILYQQNGNKNKLRKNVADTTNQNGFYQQSLFAFNVTTHNPVQNAKT